MAKKVVIPLELKYNYMKGMVTTLLKGFLYEIREEYGAAAALKLYERLNKRDDRIKKMTTTLKDVFKIEGDDMEAIANWFDIYLAITGTEITWLERSKTFTRARCPMGCAWKTVYKDISDWILIFFNEIVKTINPKATIERPKGMCLGDPYCEYITRIKE